MLNDRWYVPMNRSRGSPAAECAPESGRLVALLEYLPQARPPEGLLARIENRVDAIERARSAAEARSNRSHARWRVLGAAVAGALAGAAAMAAVLLAGLAC